MSGWIIPLPQLTIRITEIVPKLKNQIVWDSLRALPTMKSWRRRQINKEPNYSNALRNMTCTVRKLQTKLFEKHNITVSLGTVHNLKPFYVSFPTEKEKILCMCKFCLNTRMKFDIMMEYSKSHSGKAFTSVSNFFIRKLCVWQIRGKLLVFMLLW